MDMPYLFELQDRAMQLGDDAHVVDWLEIYGQMVVQSYPGLWKRESDNDPDQSKRYVIADSAVRVYSHF